MGPNAVEQRISGSEAVAQRARRREREAPLGFGRGPLALREVLVEEQALRIDGDPMASRAPPDRELELSLLDRVHPDAGHMPVDE